MAGWHKILEAAGSLLDIPLKLVERATGNDPASLEKVRGRLERERAEREAELERARSERKILELNAHEDAEAAAKRLEYELWKEEQEFKLSAVKDLIAFVSDVKILHAERVMNLSVEFEKLYSDQFDEAQRRHEDNNERRKKFMIELIPLRETAPEVFAELVEGYRSVFKAYAEHVSILLHRMREDLPRLRDRVIDQVTQYQPDALLERLGNAGPRLGAPEAKELPPRTTEPGPRKSRS